MDHPAHLTGTDLRFAGDGGTLVVHDGDGLQAVDPADGTVRWRAAVDGARDLALLGRAVWVLATDSLCAIDLVTGTRGAAVAVPAATAPLIATAPSSLACGGDHAWVARIDGHAATLDRAAAAVRAGDPDGRRPRGRRPRRRRGAPP